MSENASVKTNSVVTEAPASWNTRYVTPDGFVCQITLRGDSGKDLLEKANVALTWLKENGYLPCENNSFRPRNSGSKPKTDSPANNNGHSNNGNGNNRDHPAEFCPIHQCEMKKWEKDGRIWYSHKVDGGWCTGKSK